MAKKRPTGNEARRRGRDSCGGKEKQAQISLCMIVRDEEEFLSGCLESAKGVVDEIVIVDTGSSDRTVEVAREFGAQVYYHEWNDDFASARNESLEHANCGWVLVLDADERLDAGAGAALRGVARGGGPKAIYACKVVNRHDSMKTTEHVSSRFFPRNCGIAYEGVVHERPVPSERRPLSGGRVPYMLQDFVVIHEGYREDMTEKRNKHDRNVALLERALAVENNPYYRYKLGATHLERGQVCEAIDHLRRAVDDLQCPPRGGLDHAVKVHALLLLSQAYLKAGQLGASKACAEEALCACPESRLAQYQMGLILFELGDPEEACSVFARIAAQAEVSGFCSQDSLGFDPSIDTWKSRVMAARCSLQLGNPVGAARFLVEAAGFLPRNPEYIDTIRRTVSDFETMRTRGSACEGADLEFLRGVMREEAGNRKSAADDCFDANHYANALKLYAAALALGYPPDGALLTRLASCLVRTGRKHDGFATYLKALRSAPADVGSLGLLLELTQAFKAEASTPTATTATQAAARAAN